MEWIINIEGEKSIRMKIIFLPLTEEIMLCGQYKPKNREWEDFHKVTVFYDIEAKQLVEELYRVYYTTQERVSKFEDFDKGIDLIKTIQITEEK